MKRVIINANENHSQLEACLRFFILIIQQGNTLRLLGYAHIDPRYRRRLMAAGLVVGCQFRIKRLAPVGGTCEIEYLGESICLRKHEMSKMQLEQVEI